MKPGVYKNMSFADYLAIDAVNHSSLKNFDLSPRKYKENAKKDSAALSLGRAIHSIVLEPVDYVENYVTFTGKVRRGKAWDEFQALNSNKEIITQKERDTCNNAFKQVNECKRAMEILDGAETELSIVWTDEKTGILCKARIDALGKIFCDLKTTSKETPDQFIASAAKYFYHTQFAYYRRALRAHNLPFESVEIIAVQTIENGEAFTVTVPDETLDEGDKILDQWMAELKECLKTDEWPGYEEREFIFYLPKWAKAKQEIKKLSRELQYQYDKLDWSER